MKRQGEPERFFLREPTSLSVLYFYNNICFSGVRCVKEVWKYIVTSVHKPSIDELVSYPSDVENMGGMRWVIFNLLPDIGDMAIYGPE